MVATMHYKWPENPNLGPLPAYQFKLAFACVDILYRSCVYLLERPALIGHTLLFKTGREKERAAAHGKTQETFQKRF